MQPRILTNAATTRRTWHKGREYIVAPLSMIVPGVLPGSKGSLYYPPQEVARNARGWDGMPITVNHPTDPMTNESLSARKRGVWGRQGIGRVKSTTFNGKLQAEGWFDVKRTAQVDNRILAALNRGESIELSTGLFTDNEYAPGSHNGRPYTHIARNYRPDHLAVLPDQRGACSREDGCGVLVNSGDDKKQGCGDGG